MLGMALGSVAVSLGASPGDVWSTLPEPGSVLLVSPNSDDGSVR